MKVIVGAHGEPEHLADIQRAMNADWKPLFDEEPSIACVNRHIEGLVNSKFHDSLAAYKTFLPPRLVSAAKAGQVAPFFGAGVSIAAGIPTWAGLLKKLGVSDDLAYEPNLENDPLTLAELLAHEIGFRELQKELRKLMKASALPSLAHYLLAQMSQGVYVTTNYDTLFEKAWQSRNGVEPIVVTTDADFSKYGLNPLRLAPKGDQIVLLKIHGCANRDDEELILTRSQYRRHYRTNTLLFEAVRELMLTKHMLFMGFSHRDPEISRLVDDAIHKYRDKGTKAPEFYSLQFDMKDRTPEVFAARGMLALRPPVSLSEPEGLDYRAAGLYKALIDICAGMDSDVHKALDLDAELRDCINQLQTAVSSAKATLCDAARMIETDLSNDAFVQSTLDATLAALGDKAGQGVYLLQRNGNIDKYAIPAQLTDPDRFKKPKLADRFYVQQAKTYKEFFVSDSAASKFNEQSTIFFCAPLGSKSKYEGLLFCASQIGFWKAPLNVRNKFLASHPDCSFVLVDSNGVLLIPPNDEFPVGPPPLIPAGESADVNLGFSYEKLRRISRRDQLVIRMWRNIVPIHQDDDICNFSDLGMYSVVGEVEGTRWKLALAKPVSI
jgi:hypothetical protein